MPTRATSPSASSCRASGGLRRTCSAHRGVVYSHCICCINGDAAAVAAFRERALVPSLRGALARLGAPAATVDEALQRVLVMLFVGEGGAPQIATYGGRGTLRSWLRTIGLRTGRRLMGVLHGGPDGGDDLDALPAAVRDPELELLRERYRDHVGRAFATAFTRLTERQRNLLRQYHIDGLTIDQLAALYRVNRATTARWVAAARMAVVAATREQLVADLGVDAGEVDSIIRLVRSQLELSLRALAER
ncbi:MAG: transcriptional regulator [Deltaproteobacteria bacterium]|nr:transcriptional regulator [Deltaproteobacteria bacterium]